MSHPAPHPGTPTPPPGPSRREIAAIAGSYGRSAQPLTGYARTLIYREQIGRNRLTPRQRRRRDHKENRRFREFLAA